MTLKHGVQPVFESPTMTLGRTIAAGRPLSWTTCSASSFVRSCVLRKSWPTSPWGPPPPPRRAARRRDVHDAIEHAVVLRLARELHDLTRALDVDAARILELEREAHRRR